MQRHLSWGCHSLNDIPDISHIKGGASAHMLLNILEKLAREARGG